MTQERPSLLHHLRHLAAAARIDEASDQELVEAFAAHRDETAFGALVRRHGAMVLDLCRRALGNEADAEDAFQATFLVLAKKARALRSRERVSAWLYGVARRTALKARTARARRSAHEPAAPPAPPAADPVQELTVREARAVIDEELARLPDKYRAPVILCCLEGLARDEAARQLGWATSLVKSRLEQGRELLRCRLSSRGLGLSAGLLSLGLVGMTAQAGVAPTLAANTVQAAVSVAAGLPTSLVSATVMTLSEGMVRTMFGAKWKLLLGVAVVVAALAAGASGAMLGSRGAGGPAGVAGRARTFAPVPEPAPLPGVKESPLAKMKPGTLPKWAQSEVICTAALTRVIAGPVGRSIPPVYTHTLVLKVEETVRGAVKKGEMIQAFHSIRQENEPTFPEGKDCVVGLKKTRGSWQAVIVEGKAPELVRQVRLACSVPIGWTIEGGTFVSPWAKLGKKGWPAGLKSKSAVVCAKTGRPALLAAPGVELIVEKVPPAKQIKWTNPDGDGEYKVTLKNTTTKAVSVPALLHDGKAPLWDESLVLLCQGQVYAIPDAKGVRTAARPTTLKAGESISTVVNALKLQGPQWPRGGYRIEFQFALGEKSATESFYYLAKHHDVVRQRLLGGKK
jgi:RNA polymerase sigma factor (sigma-70 family)